MGGPSTRDVQVSAEGRLVETGPVVTRRAMPSPPIAIYPIATPVATILFLGASVASHPVWLIRPIAVAILFGVLVTAVITALVRDKHRAGITSWALIVGLIVDDPRASILLWGIGVVLLASGMVTRMRPWPRGPRVTSAMTVFAVALLVASLFRGLQVGGLQADVDEILFDLRNPPPASAFSTAAPDIYVLLLDAYPGATAVKSASNFDGQALPQALAARGFEVAPDARANYLVTRLTLPSMFDARHLRDIDGLTDFGTREDDARNLRLATDGGRILSELGSRGYERIALNSGYSELGPIRVDRMLVPPQLNEMEGAIFQSTGAGNAIDAISPDYLANQVRSRILDSFDSAAAVAREPRSRPRFVLIHVPAPHAPWVADARGVLVVGRSATLQTADETVNDRDERERRFYDYATWVTSLTVATIDRILAASPYPPVVAVFSDHGPDFDFNMEDPLSSDLDLRTSTFMAVLVPGGADLLPDDATVVNMLPFVLNASLGTEFAIQPNKFWAWRTGSSILDLVELDPRTWKAK
jgi:hypothetical protein